MGQTWRNRSQPCARLQQPQLRRPVRQRQAEPLEVLVASPDLGFDFRDLPAAAFHSYGHLLALGGNLVEGPAVAVELGLLPAQFLPALHAHVHVFRIQLDAIADALG